MNCNAVIPLCLLAIVGAAAQAPAPGPASCASIVQTAQATPALSTLVQAVAAAGLVAPLSNSTAELTVFAPTNAAFAELLAALNLTSAQLLASPSLRPILLAHVVPGAFQSSKLSNGLAVPTLLPGANLTVLISSAPAPAPAQAAAPSPTGAHVVAVDVESAQSIAQVILPDVPACKSVVHVVDTVLVPSEDAIAQSLATA
ncbi:hypothetical protein WJX72_002189 [[Myrmecia] bisecta]|uniref:FAS1 domain-containing protein n=1 Tax=[Myrmecia] bisecta TaxID=41462 RepID=A0AAW1PCE9_9CHLO